MTALTVALQEFWSAFTLDGAALPAYPTQNVPDSAAMPYITYDAAEGGYWGTSILTAFVWVRATSGVDARAKCASVLDQVEQAIPAVGRAVVYSAGALRVRRNDAEFLSYYVNPADPGVIGGRISYEVTFFNP